MEHELINLLPPERQQALARGYFLRLGVTATITVTVLTVIAGLLLLPTYLLVTRSVVAKQEHLTNVESTLSSVDEASLSAQLSSLSNDAALLIALGHAPSASAITRTALSISRPGIVLTGFTYTPTEQIPGVLTVSGVAETRDALRTYQLALQDAPFSTAADLPVSAYAKDTDITFTITVTLAP